MGVAASCCPRRSKTSCGLEGERNPAASDRAFKGFGGGELRASTPTLLRGQTAKLTAPHDVPADAVSEPFDTHSMKKSTAVPAACNRVPALRARGTLAAQTLHYFSVLYVESHLCSLGPSRSRTMDILHIGATKTCAVAEQPAPVGALVLGQ